MSKKYDFSYVKLGDTWEAWEKNGKGNGGGFHLDWAADEIGFGQLSFLKEGGKTVCHTECMSKEFIEAALDYFLNNIELVDI